MTFAPCVTFLVVLTLAQAQAPPPAIRRRAPRQPRLNRTA